MGAVLLFHDGEQFPRPPRTPHPPKLQNGGAEWTHRRREREERNLWRLSGDVLGE